MSQPTLIIVVYYLTFFIIAASQILGIIFLGKTSRNLAWWIMLGGAILNTVGSSGLIFVQTYLMSRSLSAEESMTWMYMVGGLNTFGSLLFFIGFLIHAVTGNRQARRIQELETIIAVQADRLSHSSTGS